MHPDNEVIDLVSSGEEDDPSENGDDGNGGDDDSDGNGNNNNKIGDNEALAAFDSNIPLVVIDTPMRNAAALIGSFAAVLRRLKRFAIVPL